MTRSETTHDMRNDVRIVKGIGEVVEIIIMLLVILFFAFGSYAIWDSNQVVEHAMPTEFVVYKPDPWDGPTYPDLKEINDEVVGWITIYGTNIDYPLVQGKDNEKYLKTAADGTYSLSGAIYLDCRNDPDVTQFNNVIHGHSMSYNAMFGDIADFLELDFFNEHRTGDLYVNNVHRGLQILAILEVEAYQSGLYRMPVDYPEEKRAYIDEINEFVVNAAEDPALSIWQDAKTGRTTPEGDPVGQIGFYTIGTEDKLAVLSTCTFRITNGRHLLICRITDEVYEDPYHADPPRRQTKNYDKVGAANRNTRLLWMIMIVLIILAAAVKVTGRANKKKMRALKREKEKKSNKSNY